MFKHIKSKTGEIAISTMFAIAALGVVAGSTALRTSHIERKAIEKCQVEEGYQASTCEVLYDTKEKQLAYIKDNKATGNRGYIN